MKALTISQPFASLIADGQKFTGRSMNKLEILNNYRNQLGPASAWDKDTRSWIRIQIGEIANDWEMITGSGIIRSGIPGIHTPGSLRLPFTLSELRQLYPRLVSQTQID